MAGKGRAPRPRREALFDALAEEWADLPLFRRSDPDEEPVALPVLDEREEVLADYATTGLSLRRHPMVFAREALEGRGAVPVAHLATTRHGTRVAVGGLVITRQRPATAKGIVFITVEDETGVANLLVRPRLAERYARLVHGGTCLLARGVVEREGEVVHLVVRSLEDASPLVPRISVVTRDFH